jgi:hypothetical protein
MVILPERVSSAILGGPLTGFPSVSDDGKTHLSHTFPQDRLLVTCRTLATRLRKYVHASPITEPVLTRALLLASDLHAYQLILMALVSFRLFLVGASSLAKHTNGLKELENYEPELLPSPTDASNQLACFRRF